MMRSTSDIGPAPRLKEGSGSREELGRAAGLPAGAKDAP